MFEFAPAFGDLLRSISFAPHWLALLAGASALYAIGVRHARVGRPEIKFLRLRAAAFVLGMVTLWIAVLGPIEHYGNQALWVNFTGFLLITMVAAPLFVLASPLTLAFRALGKSGSARLRRFYRGFPMSWITFPPATWLAFAVVTYAWQFTSLTDLAAQYSLVRDAQLFTLLLVGIMFWYPAFPVDPIRWRLAHPLRGLYVVLEMAHKALFGGMFLSMESTFHTSFHENAAAWAPVPTTDQNLAILILWVGGNLVFVAALAAIVVAWLQYESRNNHRIDIRLAKQREAERQRQAALEQVFHKPV